MRLVANVLGSVVKLAGFLLGAALGGALGWRVAGWLPASFGFGLVYYDIMGAIVVGWFGGVVGVSVVEMIPGIPSGEIRDPNSIAPSDQDRPQSQDS